MKSTLKKYAAIIVISIAIASILVDCGKVELSSDIKINNDGSSSTTVKVYYDDTINTIVNNDLLSQVITKNENVLDSNIKLGDVKKYKEGELNVEEVTITTEKENLIKLALIGDEYSVNNEYVDININKKRGLIEDTYNIDLRLNKDISEDISNYIEEGVINNINGHMGINLSSYINGNISKNIKEYLKSIPYNITLSMPLKITESNAQVKINDNTIKYSFTLGELNENTNINFSIKTISILNLALLILLILIAVIFMVIKKRKNK